MSSRLRERADMLMSQEDGSCKSSGGGVSVVLVYPNTYKLGMSNLGFQTIYHLLNQQKSVVCERAFLPDRVIMDEFKRTEQPLFSLESRRPIRSFDIVAFSISFEEDFLNIPEILRLAGIPILSSERDSPLVIAGGAVTFINPEPVADVFDGLCIGEGEEMTIELIEVFRALKDRGKPAILEALAGIDGFYVPSFYRFIYKKDGTLKEIVPLHGVPARVSRRHVDITKRLPSPFITTPYSEFKKRYLIEISRGCPRGCRFCAAGYVYLPPRFKDEGFILAGIREALKSTRKIGLLGTAVSEHPSLDRILSFCLDEGIDLSISSIRMETLTEERIELLKRCGYRTFTIAPEAGSERLRKIINKPYTDDDIVNTMDMLSQAGIDRIKLYYMIGLPQESDEDIDALIDLNLRLRERLKKGILTIKINTFVPKPWTPFQWYPYTDITVLKQRYKRIKRALAFRKGIRLKFASIERGYVQALFSLGDRRVFRSLHQTLDGVGIKRAIKELLPPPEFYVYREKDRDELFPWEIIDHGIKKDRLWSIKKRAESL